MARGRCCLGTAWPPCGHQRQEFVGPLPREEEVAAAQTKQQEQRPSCKDDYPGVRFHTYSNERGRLWEASGKRRHGPKAQTKAP